MAAAAAAVVLAGCAPAAPIFRSRADLANTTPIERLLVIANVDLDDRVLRGLVGGLENRLAACGVTSQVVIGSRASDRLDTAPDTASFSAALVVRSEGGTLDKFVTDPDLKYSTLYFGFQIHDAASRKSSWVAKAELHIETHNRWQDTLECVRLATDITTRLRDDGVLPRCPPASVGWQPMRPFPGCADERRRILAEAMKLRDTADSSERSQMIASAPTCE